MLYSTVIVDALDDLSGTAVIPLAPTRGEKVVPDDMSAPEQTLEFRDAECKVYAYLAGEPDMAWVDVVTVDPTTMAAARQVLLTAFADRNLSLWFSEYSSDGEGLKRSAVLTPREYKQGLWRHRLRPHASREVRDLFNAKKKYLDAVEFDAWMVKKFANSDGQATAPAVAITPSQNQDGYEQGGPAPAKQRKTPSRDRALTALKELFPDGIPAPSDPDWQDTKLTRFVQQHMDEKKKADPRLDGPPSRETILRAAGRKTYSEHQGAY